jgi:hypothetical protein
VNRALGRSPSRRDPRTLRLARYVARDQLPAVPFARDWTHAASPIWGMYANDRVGCCTIASRAHVLQAEAANAGHQPVAVSDAEIIAAYAAVTGYDQARPETDCGAQMLDVLRFLRSSGLVGQRIGAYAAVDPLSRNDVESAINVTGSLWVGLDLPVAWQTATTWDIAPVHGDGPAYDRNTWGGHAAAVLAYDRVGLTLVTWGALKQVTWEGLRKYCSEAWATIDALWLRDDGLTPSGFDAGLLARDLALLS